MTQDDLKLVLEALKWCHGGEPCGTAEAIAVVEKALAQPEQESVADDFFRMIADRNPKPFSSPQRTWVGLTDEEISELIRATHNTGSFVRAIEAKLKDKNCVG
jgi:hypothetical protein